jgi:hypothetical protein
MGENKTRMQSFKWENIKERNNLEDRGVDWKIILKRIFKKIR